MCHLGCILQLTRFTPLKKESLSGKNKHTGRLNFLCRTTSDRALSSSHGPAEPHKTTEHWPQASCHPARSRYGERHHAARPPPGARRRRTKPPGSQAGPAAARPLTPAAAGRAEAAAPQRGERGGASPPCPQTSRPAGRPSPAALSRGWRGKRRRARCPGRPRPLQAPG